MALPPNDLPPAVSAAFHELSEEQQRAFVSSYNGRKRSMALMIALAIIFPIQLFLLGRVLLGILFLITGGGFGVWYVVEWFLTPQRVRDYNTKVANETLSLVHAGGPPTVDQEEKVDQEEE